MIGIVDIAILTVLAIYFYCLFSPKIRKRILKKKLMKTYDSIKLGDIFIRRIDSDDPFKKQWGHTIIIVDKKTNRKGVPFIKYKYNAESDKYQVMTLEDLVVVCNYEPYAGQDKQSNLQEYEDNP